MYIPACVFLYSICVYVCVGVWVRQEGRRKMREIMMIE